MMFFRSFTRLICSSILTLTTISDFLAEDTWRELSMADGAHQDWWFVEGTWNENDEILTAPQNLGDENLAFYVARAFGDLQVTFEFRWDVVWTNAGFLFRARNAQHYYMIHFPVVDQQYRIEQFWAMISKVDENGYVQVLRMELIHGVSSAPQRWHQAELRVKGNTIRLWVDGRPLTEVTDETYAAPGYVGLSTYSSLGATAKSSFRNVRIRGPKVDAPPWDTSAHPKRNWGITDPEQGTHSSNIAQAGNGDLLFYSTRRLFRSTDNGWTWTQDKGLSQAEDSNPYRLRTLPDGRLERYYL